MEIMQGDQYHIAIEILVDDQPITDISTISDVEVCLGTLKKTMANNEIIYSETEKAFLFPLTQQEAFAFPARNQSMQVRVKFQNGDVIGEKLDYVDVESSMSRTVM